MSTDAENSWSPRGREGIYWEMGIDMCALLHIKQITN